MTLHLKTRKEVKMIGICTKDQIVRRGIAKPLKHMALRMQKFMNVTLNYLTMIPYHR